MNQTARILHIDELKSNLIKSNSHNVGRVNHIVPFSQQKSEKWGNNYFFIGDFVRNSTFAA